MDSWLEKMRLGDFLSHNTIRNSWTFYICHGELDSFPILKKFSGGDQW